MRAHLQRVLSASVTVVGRDTPGGRTDTSARIERSSAGGSRQVTGSIGPGLCVLVGVTHDDTPAQAVKLARRIWELRIFADEAGIANLSAADLGLEVLVVSQFTLYADTSRGRRPSYVAAARPEKAEPLVDALVEALRASGARVATGRFRADMQVALVNDGPFTVLLEV